MSELKPRTASVVIYQGDDIERISDLSRMAEIAKRKFEAEKRAATRMGDAPSDEAVREAEAAYDSFVDEAADRAVVVEVTALKRKRFRDLMAEHPPRDKNDDDDAYTVNLDTFPEPFIHESVSKVSKGERELNPGQIRDLIEGLADGDFERLFEAAYMLNRAHGVDPREGRYSSAPRTSDAT